MEENNKQQVQNIYEISQAKSCLEQLKQFNSMSRKQKNQLASYELLRFMGKLLNIRLDSLQFSVVPIEALVQVFIHFLSQVSYEQRSIGQDIIKNNLELDREEIVILIEGVVLKQFNTFNLLMKCRKYSTREQRTHHPIKNDKHRRQMYKVGVEETPKVIWPSEDIYQLRILQDSRILKLDKTAVQQLRTAISHQERDHINAFLSRWLRIQMYYIKLFKLEHFTLKKHFKRTHRHVLQNNCLYIIYKGYLKIFVNSQSSQDQTERNAIFLTSGSILNLQSLFSKNINDIVIEVQHQVSLFAIDKDAIFKIIQQYPWMHDQFKNIQSSLSEFRNRVGKKVQVKKEELQNKQQIKDQNLTEKALQRFRKTIGMKNYQNRFRVSNTVKTQDLSDRINFISSFYPFVRMVDSQSRIADRNTDQRSKNEQINMLPQKDSKKFMAMKKRIHDEKVKHMRVKKRAQNQIKQPKYLTEKPDFADRLILQNTLFEDNLQIPQLSRRASNTRNSVKIRLSSTFRSGVSSEFEKLPVKPSNFMQKSDGKTESDRKPKYKIPIGLTKSMRNKLQIFCIDSSDQKNGLYSALNLSQQLTNKINFSQKCQFRSNSKTSQRRMLKKMGSGKIRKVKIVELQHLKVMR